MHAWSAFNTYSTCKNPRPKEHSSMFEVTQQKAKIYNDYFLQRQYIVIL